MEEERRLRGCVLTAGAMRRGYEWYQSGGKSCFAGGGLSNWQIIQELLLLEPALHLALLNTWDTAALKHCLQPLHILTRSSPLLCQTLINSCEGLSIRMFLTQEDDEGASLFKGIFTLIWGWLIRQLWTKGGSTNKHLPGGRKWRRGGWAIGGQDVRADPRGVFRGLWWKRDMRHWGRKLHLQRCRSKAHIVWQPPASIAMQPPSKPLLCESFHPGSMCMNQKNTGVFLTTT